jgi:hypothetical protein
MSWMEYRTLWDGVSVALILRLYSERVEAKKSNGTQGMVGMSAKAAGQKRMREAAAVEYFRFASTAFGCPCLAALRFANVLVASANRKSKRYSVHYTATLPGTHL